MSRPGVWTSHTGHTSCVTGFSPSRHSRAQTVCISTGQNGARLTKMAREEIGLQPRSQVILHHAQQDFRARGFSFLSIFRVPGKTAIIRERHNVFSQICTQHR